jgi:hypothetical protein
MKTIHTKVFDIYTAENLGDFEHFCYTHLLALEVIGHILTPIEDVIREAIWDRES